MLACFAAVPRLGLEEPARVCVRVRVCAPICFNHDALVFWHCFLVHSYIWPARHDHHAIIEVTLVRACYPRTRITHTQTHTQAHTNKYTTLPGLICCKMRCAIHACKAMGRKGGKQTRHRAQGRGNTCTRHPCKHTAKSSDSRKTRRTDPIITKNATTKLQ